MPCVLLKNRFEKAVARLMVYSTNSASIRHH